MARSFAELDKFERAVDELFEDLVTRRWRHVQAAIETSSIRENRDNYEVRLMTGEIDPERLEVEATESRLTVRVRGQSGGLTERTFTFSSPIDRDAVTARWSERELTIVLPKKRQGSTR